jgi:hypothetical protein
MLFQNICGDGYTQLPPALPLGMVEVLRSVGSGFDWLEDGRLLAWDGMLLDGSIG